MVHEPIARVDRYHQWLASDPANGDIYVAYLDTRNDPNRRGTDTYVSRSVDCGFSWEPSVRASSETSYAAGEFQYGDYQGLSVLNGHVYPAWADFRTELSTRNTEADVNVGRLVFDASTPGWSAKQLSDALVLTFHNEQPGSLDAYVKVSDTASSWLYLNTDGRLSPAAVSFPVSRAPEGYAVRLSLDLLRAVDASASLRVVLVGADTVPEVASALVSSEARFSMRDVAAGTALGCAAAANR